MKKLLLFFFVSLISCDTGRDPVLSNADRDTVYMDRACDSTRAAITFLQNGVAITYCGDIFIADTVKYYSDDRVMVEWTCPCDFEATLFIGTGTCRDSVKTCSQIEYK